LSGQKVGFHLDLGIDCEGKVVANRVGRISFEFAVNGRGRGDKYGLQVLWERVIGERKPIALSSYIYC